MKLSEIQIRDPFVLPVKETGFYYLYGSTDKNIWSGPATGFDCYRSRDLVEWVGPIPAFRRSEKFWATTQFWAPEVHAYRGRYYMFATFKSNKHCRGTQILVADRPEGPYAPWSNGPVTPEEWECLDGTLHLDEASKPWIVFCHEWLQVHDGGMYAQRLSLNLKRVIGRPKLLFNASAAPWVQPLERKNKQQIAGAIAPGFESPNYVTDGPFLYRTKGGSLLMLWSSFGKKGYAMGIARSNSGSIKGPWRQGPKPIWEKNGGHGMLFRKFDGRLFIALHQPNETPKERAIFHLPRGEHFDGDLPAVVEAVRTIGGQRGQPVKRIGAGE